MKIYLTLLLVLLSCGPSDLSTDIVIVDVGELDREGIAREIEMIRASEPSVIAIDLQFVERKEHRKDSILASVLRGCKKLVMVSVIEDFTNDKAQYDSLSLPLSDFIVNARIGYANTILEKDDLGTLKKFSVKEVVNGRTEFSFAVQTALAFDSLKTVAFIQSNDRVVNVDFRKDKEIFKVITRYDVLNGNFDQKMIKGKIVLFGYLGGLYEDKFYTPLNSGRKPLEPDMYGVEYHANVIAQVLRAK